METLWWRQAGGRGSGVAAERDQDVPELEGAEGGREAAQGGAEAALTPEPTQAWKTGPCQTAALIFFNLQNEKLLSFVLPTVLIK